MQKRTKLSTHSLKSRVFCFKEILLLKGNIFLTKPAFLKISENIHKVRMSTPYKGSRDVSALVIDLMIYTKSKKILHYYPMHL